MMFGIAVKTSNGMKNLTELMTARVVHRLTSSTMEGAAVIPNFSITRGAYLMLASHDGLQLPATGWTEGSKTFSW